MIQQSLDMPHSHQIIRHDAIMLIWCITIEMSNTGDASWINKSRSWQPYYECGHLHIVRPFLPPSPHFTEPSPPCAWISFVDVLLVNFCYIFQEPINPIMLDCLKISLIFGWPFVKRFALCNLTVVLSCLSCLWRWCIVAKQLDGSRWNLARR